MFFTKMQPIIFHASASNVYTWMLGFGVMPLQAAQEAKYKKLKWDNKALGGQSVSQKVYISNFELHCLFICAILDHFLRLT